MDTPVPEFAGGHAEAATETSVLSPSIASEPLIPLATDLVSSELSEEDGETPMECVDAVIGKPCPLHDQGRKRPCKQSMNALDICPHFKRTNKRCEIWTLFRAHASLWKHVCLHAYVVVSC